jgi:hypothetical protein
MNKYRLSKRIYICNGSSSRGLYQYRRFFEKRIVFASHLQVEDWTYTAWEETVTNIYVVLKKITNFAVLLQVGQLNRNFLQGDTASLEGAVYLYPSSGNSICMSPFLYMRYRSNALLEEPRQTICSS